MIDLVPVVRCKNCEKACKNIIGDMTVYDCDGRVVRADFFCADAVPDTQEITFGISSGTGMSATR